MSRLLVALAALLLAPTAAAGWFSNDEPPTVTIPLGRAGDTWQYASDVRRIDASFEDGEIHERPVDENWTEVLLLEGPSRVQDKYGIERDAFAYRHDRFLGGELRWAQRCHQLAGGREAVAREMLTPSLAGASSWGSDGSVGPIDLGSERGESTTYLEAQYESYPCAGSNPLAGRTVRPGDALTYRDLVGWAPGDLADLPTLPATLESFQGRAALRFVFDLASLPEPYTSDGTSWLVVADGLPVVVERGSYASEDDHSVSRLVGYAQGQGDAVPPDGGARLPERDPNGEFEPYDPRIFDDRAYGLRFTYAEAYAQLLAQPGSRLKAYLDAHPDAWLFSAFYFPTNADPGSALLPDIGPTREDGTWWLLFTDDDEAIYATASRSSAEAGPVRQALPGGLPWDVSPLGSAEFDSMQLERPDVDELATSARLVERAAEKGVDTSSIQQVAYFAFSFAGEAMILVEIGDVAPTSDETQGREVTFSATTGGLGSVASRESRTERSGLLAPEGGLDARRDDKLSALAALAGPGVGTGLGVGAAATGAALLVVAVKFLLVPLFTRLRRASLLDNPVRARLYDHVLREPGIHQSELVDFAGVGRGATTRHLAQLARHGYVVEVRDEGYTRYFAAGEVPAPLARRHAALKAGSAARVYELLAAEPHLSLREAGARLGMSAPSVHRAKKKLENAGLLPAAPEVATTTSRS